jgi:sarcosine oxidase delta subunit
MIFCPYCLTGGREASDSAVDFRFTAPTLAEDDPNSKTLEMAVHWHGCGKVFLVVRDKRIPRPAACFKLPADWAYPLPTRNPP